MSYKELLSAYEVDVQFSDVSGMEHLDMLMIRSEIAKHEPHLTDGERRTALKRRPIVKKSSISVLSSYPGNC